MVAGEGGCAPRPVPDYDIVTAVLDRQSGGAVSARMAESRRRQQRSGGARRAPGRAVWQGNGMHVTGWPGGGWRWVLQPAVVSRGRLAVSGERARDLAPRPEEPSMAAVRLLVGIRRAGAHQRRVQERTRC